MNSDRKEPGNSVAPLIMGYLILLGGIVTASTWRTAIPVKQPVVTNFKPKSIASIPNQKKAIGNIPVKMSISDTLTIALSSHQVGAVKWAATIEYSAASYTDSLLDSDRITISNAIQDDLSKRSSTQLAMQMSNIRKNILAKLPKTVRSIQLEASPELLAGFRDEELRSVPIAIPTFRVN